MNSSNGDRLASRASNGSKKGQCRMKCGRGIGQEESSFPFGTARLALQSTVLGNGAACLGRTTTFTLVAGGEMNSFHIHDV